MNTELPEQKVTLYRTWEIEVSIAGGSMTINQLGNDNQVTDSVLLMSHHQARHLAKLLNQWANSEEDQLFRETAN